MKKRIKRSLIIAAVGGLLLCYNIPANALSSQSSEIVNQNSIIEEQQEISYENLEPIVVWKTQTPFIMKEVPPSSEIIDVLVKKTEGVIKDTPKEVYTRGYTTTRVNIRKEANTTSKVLTTLNFNTPILYMKNEQSSDWLQIKYEDTIAYIAQEYVSNTKCEYEKYEIPNNDGFKSYMGYTAITSTTSNQYKIQHEYAYTGTYGIRQVNGRYCVALGSYFNVNIGQYFDLILKNGMVIPCILGDAKADIHTDENNLFTITNECCSEFIVDSSRLNSNAKTSGDISLCDEDWNSPVVEVRVYEENILE